MHHKKINVHCLYFSLVPLSPREAPRLPTLSLQCPRGPPRESAGGPPGAPNEAPRKHILIKFVVFTFSHVLLACYSIYIVFTCFKVFYFFVTFFLILQAGLAGRPPEEAPREAPRGGPREAPRGGPPGEEAHMPLICAFSWGSWGLPGGLLQAPWGVPGGLLGKRGDNKK